MKAEFDKEIDALLRRTARAAGGGARASQVAEGHAHLDADELSAFAENALPAPARLAAVSHLADCERCRGLVVNLSSAAGGAGVEPEKRAGVAPAVNERETAGKVGWLAALFSPRLLRFAAPALALCLVGAIAFVVMRARRDGGTVAQRTAKEPLGRTDVKEGAGAGGDAAVNAGASGETNTTTTANMAANTNTSAATSDAGPPAAEERSDTSAATREPEAPDGSGPRPADDRARKQSPEAAEGEAAPAPKPAAAEAPPQTAPVAAVAAPPPPAPDARERRQETTRRGGEDEVARADDAAQERRSNQAGNFEYRQQSPDGSRDRAGSGRAAQSSPRSITEPAARPRAKREPAPAGPPGETREAAGHRFRREGGAWVDVNYRPSMAMTGVRRSTESYRALVADIPVLGRIAEQLSGEVVVVVSGRAYRIR